VFGNRVFNPKPLLATITVSRQLLQQSSPDLESYLRSDFGRALAEAIDAAGIAGPGSVNRPVGLLRSGIGDRPLGTNGGTLTADDVLALEKAVGENNANVTAWLASPALRKKLRQTPRFASGTADALWTDSNTLLGAPAFATMNVPGNVTKGSSTDCTTLVGGDFSNVVTAIWSLEIVVDQYSGKKSGMIELGLWAMADINVLRPGAFCATQDARP
jgi:HK97 family phage major capsid protein